MTLDRGPGVAALGGFVDQDPLVQLTETADHHDAFPRLTERQIRVLAQIGHRRQTTRGERLYSQGDRTCDFYVIVSGLVAVIDCSDAANDQIVGVHGAGRFLGELSLLTGEAIFVTAVVVEPGEVIAIPVNTLTQLLTNDTELADVVLRAYLTRRSMLIEAGKGFRVVGSRFSATPGGCGSSPCATASLTGSSTSRLIGQPKRWCASSGGPRRHPPGPLG